MRLRVAACVLALAWLAGCARDDATSRQVVQLWAMGQESEALAGMLPAFAQRHPGIEVRLQQLPWTAAHEKLLTAFAGDALPDVVPIGNSWIAEFHQLGALEPLDARIAATPGLSAQDYFPGAWDSGLIDGQVYAVPWYIETRLPFYRRDLLAKAGIATPPRDWAQWRAAMRAVKAGGGSEYGILLPTNEFEPLLNLAVQQGEPLLRDGGRYGNFRSTGFRRTLAFYKSLFDAGLAPRVDNTRISNVWNEFGRGMYSYYISGPWNIAEFRKRLPANLSGAWATMPLPGPDGPGASIIGGTSFVVFRSSRHKDAAWTLVAWLSEPAQQLELHRRVGDLPPRRSAWSGPALSGDANAQAFREQLERAVPAPKVPEWERIAQEMRIVSEQLVAGRLDVDAAAAELDRRADLILAKRRWMLDQRRQAAP
ncbi:MAG: sugar ABC transporter substrate-binding protein [Thermomonas sp.]|uniref:sugar ABC transporter substrate-binding protein n=1 Tax=Thermomonas sp. TaxID=1971895 RepID=UPI0039E4CDD3